MICNSKIRYDGSNSAGYCTGCGKAHPWTRYTLRIARELVSSAAELNTQEQQDLLANIRDVAEASPSAKKSARSAAEILKKAVGSTGLLSGFEGLV